MELHHTKPFESKPKDGDKKVRFVADIFFEDEQDVIDAACKYVVWRMQQHARSGDIAPGSTTKTNGRGEIVKPVRVTDATIKAMQPEDARNLFDKLRQMFEPELAKMQELAKDEPKTVKVKTS